MPAVRARSRCGSVRYSAGTLPSMRASMRQPTRPSRYCMSICRPVGVYEGLPARLVGVVPLRPVDRLQQKVVEQEREIEHRVAAVNDLPVDDPQSVVADEDVLRRVVAVNDALLRRQQPVDVRADAVGEPGMPPLDRAQVWIDALGLERLGAAGNLRWPNAARQAAWRAAPPPPSSAVPSSRRAFHGRHSGGASSITSANASGSESSSVGTEPGASRAISSSACASAAARLGGTSHSSVTRKRSSACLTTTRLPSPRTANTAHATPPVSSSTSRPSAAAKTPRRSRYGPTVSLDNRSRTRASSPKC